MIALEAIYNQKCGFRGFTYRFCCCDILVPQEPVLIVWEFIMLASVLVLPYTIAFDIDFVLE